MHNLSRLVVQREGILDMSTSAATTPRATLHSTGAVSPLYHNNSKQH